MKKIARSLIQFDMAEPGDKFRIWKDGQETFGKVVAKSKDRIKLEIISEPPAGFPIPQSVSTRTFSRDTIKKWSSFKILLNGVDRASRRMLQLKEKVEE